MEEAVLLGDRVLVFDQGALVRELVVDLPRPRERQDPAVARLTGELLDTIFRAQPLPALQSAAASEAPASTPLVLPVRSERA